MSLSKGGGDEEGTQSPNSRLKFLCSYGGKIFPRPSDGQLKYVGGETRVVSVPRLITFQELKDKISGMFNNADIVIKYQVFPEDLDTLVSVRTDEDMQYMLEEYDRHECLPRSPSSSPRFRIFLFPLISTNNTTPSSASPTYCDAMKNAKESPNIPIPSPRPSPPVFSVSSSAFCSPPSNMDNSSPITSTRSSAHGMHRVRSTPNLGAGSLSLLGNGRVTNESPKGGGGGLGINNPPPPLQQQRMMGYGGMRSRVGVSYRYEMCVCGRVFARGGHMCGHYGQKRYYYPPSYSGGGLTCGRLGHAEGFHAHTPPNSTNNSVNFTIMSPSARMRSNWES